MEWETTDIESIETAIWRLLQHAVTNYKAHFHTATIATVFENVPYARTVVLRYADKEKRQLRFHTDTRSPKFKHLAAFPLMSWLFYSPELKLQLRVQATATVHTNDAIADEAWLASRTSSKMCYTTSSGSGGELAFPEPVDFSKRVMTADEELFARKNFCVIVSTVQSIDWLHLHHEGHKRCCIDYVSNKRMWLQP